MDNTSSLLGKSPRTMEGHNIAKQIDWLPQLVVVGSFACHIPPWPAKYSLLFTTGKTEPSLVRVMNTEESMEDQNQEGACSHDYSSGFNLQLLAHTAAS